MNYFITAIVDHSTYRTFGYFKTEKWAFDAVDKNLGDMQECLYKYIIIERINEGIHASVCEEFWFEWHHTGNSSAGFQEGHWEKCSRPSQFKETTNWALG